MGKRSKGLEAFANAGDWLAESLATRKARALRRAEQRICKALGLAWAELSREQLEGMRAELGACFEAGGRASLGQD